MVNNATQEVLELQNTAISPRQGTEPCNHTPSLNNLTAQQLSWHRGI